MRRAVFIRMMVGVLGVGVMVCGGCARDSDVTAAPEYKFALAGTVWKTKVRAAIVEDTSSGMMYLLPPRYFDSTQPGYTGMNNGRVVATLPAGTRVRIERLMKSTGNWAGVRVMATVDGWAEPTKEVELNTDYLMENKFISRGGHLDSDVWTVDPGMLEK